MPRTAPGVGMHKAKKNKQVAVEPLREPPGTMLPRVSRQHRPRSRLLRSARGDRLLMRDLETRSLT
eukprot:scaffold82569_cov34-Phaeocystis_antarctica.AAC.1